LVTLLLFTNIGWCQEELYTFDAPTIDKIIVESEQCKAQTASLNSCGKLVTVLEESNKVCTDQVKLCEDSSLKKDEVIKTQQETLGDVQKLVDNEATKNTWKEIWLRIEWSVVGVVVGAIVGALLL
jgi:hypothetical protein